MVPSKQKLILQLNTNYIKFHQKVLQKLSEIQSNFPLKMTCKMQYRIMHDITAQEGFICIRIAAQRNCQLSAMSTNSLVVSSS
jgi:hypothetical protein